MNHEYHFSFSRQLFISDRQTSPIELFSMFRLVRIPTDRGKLIALHFQFNNSTFSVRQFNDSPVLQFYNSSVLHFQFPSSTVRRFPNSTVLQFYIFSSSVRRFPSSTLLQFYSSTLLQFPPSHQINFTTFHLIIKH